MKWTSLRLSGVSWTDTGQIAALSKAIIEAITRTMYEAERTIQNWSV